MAYTQYFQEVSDIPIFNIIGDINDKYGLVFFKVDYPITSDECTEVPYLHYIHLYHEDDVYLSIYYDKYAVMGSLPGVPYYELYYKGDVQRFYESDEELLISVVEKILGE